MPKIIRRGAPNSKTPGVLGQEYLDKDTKKTYICTHVDVEPGDRSGETTATYTWTPEGSGGGGGVSWNDLTDKPFYEEPGKDYILKDLDLAPMEYEGQGVMYFNPVLNIDSIPTGKPILLDFFGKTYVGEDDRSDNNGIRFYGVSFDYPDEYGTRTDARIRLRNNYFSIENGYTADLSFWAGVKASVYTEGTEVHTLDPKYIKDMYYSEMALKPLIKDYTFTTKTSGNEIRKHYIYAGDLNYYPTLVVGDTYTITVDGVDYKVVATKNSGIPENADGDYDFTQCPVYIGQGSSGNVVFITETPGETHTVSFYHDGDMEEVVHTIPEKYLPGSFYDVATPVEVANIIMGEAPEEGEITLEQTGTYEAVMSGKSIRFVAEVEQNGQFMKFVLEPMFTATMNMGDYPMVSVMVIGIDHETFSPKLLSITIIG